MTIVPINKKTSKTRANTGCLSTDNLLTDILSKKKQDINEGDVKSLQKELFINRNPILNAVVQSYYDDLYGTEPAPKDEFGQYYTVEPTEKQKSNALSAFADNLQKAVDKKEAEKEKQKREKEEKTLDEDDEFADNFCEETEEEKFIWKSNGCEACTQYNGQEFTLEEVPNTHPNCKCELISKDNPQKTIKPEFDSDKYHREKEEERRLLELTKKRLKEDENIKYHPYLDTKGIITTGNGANIDSKEAFMNVNWQVDGRPATKAEKEAAYKAMKNTKKNGKYGQKFGAQYYKNKTNLRIDDKEAERMRDEHLKKDLKEIKKEVPGFDNLPFELKEVLMDIKYNTGNVKDKEGCWPNLHQAILDKDIEKIAKETHRQDVGQKRNDWARNKILSIKKW